MQKQKQEQQQQQKDKLTTVSLSKKQKITDYFSRVIPSPTTRMDMDCASLNSSHSVDNLCDQENQDHDTSSSPQNELEIDCLNKQQSEVEMKSPMSSTVTVEQTNKVSTSSDIPSSVNCGANKTAATFVKLKDVLVDTNLPSDLAKIRNVYILYKYPCRRDQIPFPLDWTDQFSGETTGIRLPFEDRINVNHNSITVNKWKLIKQLYSETKIESIFHLEKCIKTYQPKLHAFSFDILRCYVHGVLNYEEKKYFFDRLLPAIIKLAMKLPSLFPRSVPVLEACTETILFLSRQQISSLLANAFLCTYTTRDPRRCLNMTLLYCTANNVKRRACKMEKLKCLFRYFRQVTEHTPIGVVSFERQHLKQYSLSETNPGSVCQFEFNTNRCIFADGVDYTQVDFAHKFVGGGVLDAGCVQEEILFLICPELIVARLFNVKLSERDALLITGVEQYSSYSGYGESFRWAGAYQDRLPRDKYGRVMRQVVAMDATAFSWRNKTTQFHRSMIDHEIVKAMSAFQPERILLNSTTNKLFPAIATGNWGCGVYNGEPYLKTLIQIIAASMQQRNLIYFAFDKEEIKIDFDQLKVLFESMTEKLTIGQLYRITLEYASKLISTKKDVDLVNHFIDSLSPSQ